jgi:excisionase family DNA binding protein
MASTLTVQQVAEYLGVGEKSVLAYIAAGHLRAMNVGRKVGGKRPTWRITGEALESFCLIRTATPPVPKTRRRKRQPEVIEFYR